MNICVYDHRSGADVATKECIDEIRKVFDSIRWNRQTTTVRQFRSEIMVELKKLGWSDQVTLDREVKITITSMRDHIGLCMQTGNWSRIYADLLKLQALYVKGTIKGGVIIIPTIACGLTFGKNIASCERLERELQYFNQVVTMPIAVLGFYD